MNFLAGDFSGLARELDRGTVDVRDPVLQAEGLQLVPARPECVRLDDSRARLDVLEMAVEDEIGLRETEIFHAGLWRGQTALEQRAHAPIGTRMRSSRAARNGDRFRLLLKAGAS
jgi:hypothetical protein